MSASAASRDEPKKAPTLAVALHFERGSGEAPRVVASGKGTVGDKIIETAQKHGVPLRENAPLAAALSEVEIGEEIPTELYKAVAEILAFLLKVSHRVR